MTLCFTRVPVLALAFALMSVPALAQHVDTDFDRSTNFAAFKTFAIGDIKMSEDTSPLMMQRIVGAIEGNLRVLGLRKVETNPDIVISVKGDTREELVYTGWGDPYWWGPGPYWGGVAYPYYGYGGFYGWNAYPIVVGRLILDVTDTHTDKVVFRGTAQDELSSKARKNERKSFDAVEKIFEKSPWGRKFDPD